MSDDAWFPGIDSPNFTQFPNALLDSVMARVSPTEWKVVSLVVRETAGWHVETADISVDQIVAGTGLSRATVFRALGELARQGVLVSQKNAAPNGGSLPTTYGLRYRDRGVNARPQPDKSETPPRLSATPPLPIEERNPVKETEAAEVWKDILTRATLPGPIRQMLSDVPVRLEGNDLVVQSTDQNVRRQAGYLGVAAAPRRVRFAT